MATILVVDDSPIDRRLAGGLIEKNPEFSVRYAEQGAAAIAQIMREPPDLVVSDLQMPEMDGLELVEAVRQRAPLVPVIIMTAHGSEEIAVQALARGAASYVPKGALARDLLDTVENVLAVARADRRNERLRECLISHETTFVLDNDPQLMPPLVDLLQELVTRMRMGDETCRIRVGIALEEALLNALYHGNLELSTDELREASTSLLEKPSDNPIDHRRRHSPYRERRIHVHARVTPEEIVYSIRDEGPGFDPRTIPDPTDPANLERESGRGLVLMRTFMDDVTYNDRGNEVRMTKRRENC